LTISHEVAHIVCFYHYKNSRHNKQWKRVCISLGGDGKTRCSLNLTPKRIHLYFQYLLDNGKITWISRTRHRRIQKGTTYVFPKIHQTVTKDHYTGRIRNRLTIDKSA
jgi:predicted SprT family Zn-dependent metalloprotease